jgi:hypothetical protein
MTQRGDQLVGRAVQAPAIQLSGSRSATAMSTLV